MADFPTQVNAMQAPAVEGDFASANPRKTVLAGEGALVAGRASSPARLSPASWSAASAGCRTPASTTTKPRRSSTPSARACRRAWCTVSQVGLITAYLATASMVLLKGQQTELFNDVDLWVKNTGATYAQVGMKAFANFADGTATSRPPARPRRAATGSASSIAAGTFSATGSIADNIATVTNVGSGSARSRRVRSPAPASRPAPRSSRS
jgi:hypothetical protein